MQLSALKLLSYYYPQTSCPYISGQEFTNCNMIARNLFKGLTINYWAPLAKIRSGVLAIIRYRLPRRAAKCTSLKSPETIPIFLPISITFYQEKKCPLSIKQIPPTRRKHQLPDSGPLDFPNCGPLDFPKCGPLDFPEATGNPVARNLQPCGLQVTSLYMRIRELCMSCACLWYCHNDLVRATSLKHNLLKRR